MSDQARRARAAAARQRQQQQQQPPPSPAVLSQQQQQQQPQTRTGTAAATPATPAAATTTTPAATLSVLPVENWPDECDDEQPSTATAAATKVAALFEDDVNAAIDLFACGGSAANKAASAAATWKRPQPQRAGDPPLCVVSATTPPTPATVAVPAAAAGGGGGGPLLLLASALSAILSSSSSLSSAAVQQQQPWQLIHPKNAQGDPKYTAAGRYEVKLCWGGLWKRVVVDDRMPFDTAGEPLLLQSTTRNELWPAILSKAVLKLLTGRSHPLLRSELFFVHVLTGAVPEQFGGGITSTTTTAAATSPLPPLRWDALHALLTQQQELAILPVAVPRSAAAAAAAAAAASSSPTDATATSILLVSAKTAAETTEEASGRDEARSVVLSTTTAATATRELQTEEEFWKSNVLHVFKSTATLPHRCFVEQDAQKPVPHAVVIDAAESGGGGGGGGEDVQLVVCAFVSPTAAQTARAFGKPGAHPPPPPSLSPPSEAAGTWTLEAFEWSTSPLGTPKAVLTVKGATMAAGSVKLPAGKHVLVLKTECPWTSRIGFWASCPCVADELPKVLSERLGVTTSSFDGVYKTQEAQSWAVWARYSVVVKAPLVLGAKLHVSDEISRQFAVLRLVNNDAVTTEFPTFCHVLPPTSLAPNALGYTLAVDFKAPVKVGSGSFQLQVSSTSKELSVEPDPAKHIHEHEETSMPDKEGVLFRHMFRPAATTNCSLHLQVLNAAQQQRYVQLTLQVLDNGDVVAESRGVGSITIPVVKMIKPKEDEGPHKYIVQAIASEGPQIPVTPPQTSAQQTLEPGEQTSRTASPARKQGRARGHQQQPAAQLLSQPHGSTPSATTDSSATTSQQQQKAAPPLVWRLRILSSMPVEGRKDTEKEDRIAAIKAKWEESAGPSKKAQVAREKLLEMLKNAGRPLRETGAAERAITMISVAELSKRIEERRGEISQQAHCIEALLAEGDSEKEQSVKVREALDHEMREMLTQALATQAEEAQWRDAFNKVQQEKHAAEQQRLQQELQQKQQEAAEATAAQEASQPAPAPEMPQPTASAPTEDSKATARTPQPRGRRARALQT